MCGVLVLGGLLFVTGCQGGQTSTAKGTLTVNVTDAPPSADVTSIMITVSKLEVHRAEPATQTSTSTETSTETSTTESTSEGEWITIDVPTANESFDLLKIQGVDQLLASTSIAPGKYTQIRLTIDEAEVALGGGDLKPATVPSGVLKLVHPFDIVDGETTTITLDFDAAKSVNVTGQGNIMVKPVIKLIVKPPKSEQSAQVTRETSRQTAEDFVKNGPTFAFDGIVSTLVLTNTETINSSTWRFTYEFDCSHGGYGDRTGQAVTEAVTHHVEVVTVENGSVISAEIDGAWNEITQEAIVTP